MNGFRRALLMICLGATLVWAVLAIVLIWNPDPDGAQWMGSFGIVTLAALVGLGATYYARGTE